MVVIGAVVSEVIVIVGGVVAVVDVDDVLLTCLVSWVYHAV